MPSLSEHHSSSLVKMILIGDSSTGKTGSLVSLVEAGYKLLVLDTDNGLDILKQFILKNCPDKINNVSYEIERDVYIASKSGPYCRSPRAFVNCLNHLTEWSNLDDPNCIVVIDSLTALGKAAFEWARGMDPMAKDKRAWFFTAQGAIENILAMVTSDAFKTNVIIISHVDYKELTDGTTKGYTTSVGSALGPKIPRYFNTIALAESIGAGKALQRRIQVVPTGVVDLKNPAPFKLNHHLPLESGMRTIFETLKG